MLSTPTPALLPIDLVNTALAGLRGALIAHYTLKIGLVAMPLEVQNLITSIALAQARPTYWESPARCKLLAAGIEIAANDDMAGSEHGQHVLAMCRIALEAAQRNGLYSQGSEESRGQASPA